MKFFLKQQQKNIKRLLFSVFLNASDGAHSGSNSSPLTESWVFSWHQQVHPALVVGMLIKNPIAFLHPAGEDVIGFEAVHDAWAAVCEIHRLTTKLKSFIDGQFEGTLQLF